MIENVTNSDFENLFGVYDGLPEEYKFPALQASMIMLRELQEWYNSLNEKEWNSL